MKTRILRPAIICLAVLSSWLVGSAVTASGAYADYSGFVCFDTGTGYCLTAFSPVEQGDGVFTYPSPSAWIESRPQLVTSSSPFADPKLDQSFLNHPVLQFALKSKPGLCVHNTSTDALNVEPCGSVNSELFVEAGHRLINVAATNSHDSIYELSLGDGGYSSIPDDAADGSAIYGSQHWCLDSHPGDGSCIGY
jgi:hypothetical protein